jgi:hypothetical protein
MTSMPSGGGGSPAAMWGPPSQKNGARVRLDSHGVDCGGFEDGDGSGEGVRRRTAAAAA